MPYPVPYLSEVAVSPEFDLVDSAESTREKVEWSCDSACEVCSVDADSVRRISVRQEFRAATVEAEAEAG